MGAGEISDTPSMTIQVSEKSFQFMQTPMKQCVLAKISIHKEECCAKRTYLFDPREYNG